MRDDPLFIVFDMRCSSVEEASKLYNSGEQILEPDSHIVLRSLENAIPNARVTLVYKGNDCLDWEFLRPA